MLNDKVLCILYKIPATTYSQKITSKYLRGCAGAGINSIQYARASEFLYNVERQAIACDATW